MLAVYAIVNARWRLRAAPPFRRFVPPPLGKKGSNDGVRSTRGARGAAAKGAGCDQGGIMLKEGDKAPAVTGASYGGQTFDIGALARRTVLYFYPEANTSG
jgi:hypothetical protein